jgi:hypothetical protein
MPVQLPPQPPGIHLPAQPQDPPMLADVVAAKSYKVQVDMAAVSQLHLLLLLHGGWPVYTASQQPNAPTSTDTARADVYKSNVIVAHPAIGDLWAIFTCSPRLISGKAAAPAWFLPAMNILLVPIQTTLAQVWQHVAALEKDQWTSDSQSPTSWW